MFSTSYRVFPRIALSLFVAIIIGLAIPTLFVLASSVVGNNISVTNTTEQLRLGYDPATYVSLTVDASGGFNIIAAPTSTVPFGVQLVNNRRDGGGISGSILGGYVGNVIDASSSGSVISGGGWNGGYENKILGSIGAFIGGGHGNIINSTTSSPTQDAVISGGANNQIISTDQGSIAGGNNNFMRSAFYSTIGGGMANSIDASLWSTDNAASGSTISGGMLNKIGKSGDFIGGGWGNEIYGDYSSIVGGYLNISGAPRSGAPDYSVILGGTENVLGTGASYSTIGGRKASTTHQGVFMWADSSNFKFPSVINNEAAFRSTGGVRFVTAIDGSGNATRTAQFDTSGNLNLNGGVQLNTIASKPACSLTYRGMFWVTKGAAGVADAVEVCAKDAADAYAWRTIY